MSLGVDFEVSNAQARPKMTRDADIRMTESPGQCLDYRMIGLHSPKSKAQGLFWK